LWGRIWPIGDGVMATVLRNLAVPFFVGPVCRCDCWRALPATSVSLGAAVAAGAWSGLAVVAKLAWASWTALDRWLGRHLFGPANAARHISVVGRRTLASPPGKFRPAMVASGVWWPPVRMASGGNGDSDYGHSARSFARSMVGGLPLGGRARHGRAVGFAVVA